jgi:hypothetical protein
LDEKAPLTIVVDPHHRWRRIDSLSFGPIFKEGVLDRHCNSKFSHLILLSLLSQIASRQDDYYVRNGNIHRFFIFLF